MAMLGPILASVASTAASVFGMIFQTRAAKMEAVATGVAGIVSLLKEANASDAQIAAAISASVVADAQSESWITRNWRSMSMALIVVLIVCFFFGHLPPNINGAMPPMVAELFDILKIGLYGYIPGRSLEKITKMIMTPKVVDSILSKIGGGK